MRWRWLAGGALVALCLVGAARLALGTIATRVDRGLNIVERGGEAAPSPKARALHDRLLVADLHADTLLWQRDPRGRHDYGHTDLPRYRAGGMALQVFGVVTKSPEGQNYEENDAGTDRITQLALAQGWPPATLVSLEARAQFQARRLRRLDDADERFTVIRTRHDLKALLDRRAADRREMGGILAIEGAHPLEGDLGAIQRLYDAGYRVMGLQHFFDNELGGSLHGEGKGGLTPFGKAAVTEMLRLGIVLDVAHSSEAVVRDVLALTDRPVILSHTGIASACDSPRNVSDETLDAIAQRGGMIGIGFWADAVCDASPAGIARMIVHGAERFGIDSIALGGDFDGSVTTTFDVSELALLTQALLDAGMEEDEIGKVMGENQIRFFLDNLPPDGSEG